jgi:hypothetical protein
MIVPVPVIVSAVTAATVMVRLVRVVVIGIGGRNWGKQRGVTQIVIVVDLDRAWPHVGRHKRQSWGQKPVGRDREVVRR